MHARIELPLTLPPPPTGPRFVSLGGLAAIELSVLFFASRAIYKQYMDAAHTPTFHPPTLSLFFLGLTVTFVRSFSMPEKKQQKKLHGVYYSLQTTPKIGPST